MLLNDMHHDIKQLELWRGLRTDKDLLALYAAYSGKTATPTRLVNLKAGTSSPVLPYLVELAELCGYDIEIVYKPRRGNGE